MSETIQKIRPPSEVLEDMPFQAVPPMADEKYQRLAADIKERGVIQPIITDEEGEILDGHHRAAIAEQVDLDESRKPTYVTLGDLEDDREKLARAIKTNLLGRDIDQGVKSEAVQQYIETTWPTDDETGALVKIEEQGEVADELGVSQPLVSQVCDRISRNIVTHDRIRARDYYRDNPNASYREVAREIGRGDDNQTVTEWLKEDFDEGDDEDEDDDTEQPALNLFSKDKDEAEKAQDVAQEADEDDFAAEQAERAATKETTVDDAESEYKFQKQRREREQEREAHREQRRQEYREAISDDDAVEIREGDFAEVLPEYESGTVDHIITDPPYDEDALAAWESLGEEAARVLPDDGFLVAYSGKAHLPEIYDILSAHLDYYWQFMVHHQGAGAKIFSRTLRTNYKPVLVFTPSDGGLPEREDFVSDVIEGGGREKDDHDWQQAEAEAAALIEAFTEPNDRVADPMAGSGTIGVVCQRLNRRCVLVDKDEDAIDSIYRRCVDES